MDIDQMKKSWNQINERLEKSEKVNHEAIRKLLTDKAVSGYDKIRTNEQIGAYIGISLIIVLAIFYFNGRLIKNLSSFIVIESFIALCTFYSYICFRALPKFDKNNAGGVVGIMKRTLRYLKLYTFVGPLMVLGIIVGLVLFFFLEGKGFESDNLHKAIFFTGICLGVILTIYAYRNTMAKIKEVNADIEELRRFVEEDKTN